MRIHRQSCAPAALFIVAFVALGCMTGDEDIPATAVPTTTGIPVGAPGAIGARVDPGLATASPQTAPPEPFEQKINPTPPVVPLPPDHEPVIPPSPFGDPQNDDQPPATTKKKPKGTKI